MKKLDRTMSFEIADEAAQNCSCLGFPEGNTIRPAVASIDRRRYPPHVSKSPEKGNLE